MQYIVSDVVIFPLSSICFSIVSITKLNKVADKGSPCLTLHFTINSSVRSLFTLTLALVCVKVKAILGPQISLNIVLIYSCKQSQKHVCNPQIYYTNQYYAHGFSQKICLTIKILFIVDLYGQNPIWLSSSLFCIFSIHLLFSKISNIVYAIFNNVIGL